MQRLVMGISDDLRMFAPWPAKGIPGFPLQGASAFRGATVEGEAEWRALFVAAVREAAL